MSVELKSTPSDLTVLAKKNNGVFPVGAVYEMIDGRKSVSAHSTREMPIWVFATFRRCRSGLLNQAEI